MNILKKRYKFSFINGYKWTGEPRIKTITVKARSLKEAKSKVRKDYPEATHITL